MPLGIISENAFIVLPADHLVRADCRALHHRALRLVLLIDEAVVCVTCMLNDIVTAAGRLIKVAFMCVAG